MTGARERLAEAQAAHGWEPVNRDDWSTIYRCRCGHVPANSLAMESHRVDALLPVVERIAAEKAAEELRAAAEKLGHWGDNARRYEAASNFRGSRARAYERAVNTLERRATELTWGQPC